MNRPMNLNITIPKVKGVNVVPAVCKDNKFYSLDNGGELTDTSKGNPLSVVIGQYVFFFYGKTKQIKKAHNIFIADIQKQMAN